MDILEKLKMHFTEPEYFEDLSLESILAKISNVTANMIKKD